MRCFHKEEVTALAGVVAWCVASSPQGGTFTVKGGEVAMKMRVLPNASSRLVIFPGSMMVVLS